MNNKQYFLEIIEEQIKINKKTKKMKGIYGDNVLPLIDLYSNIKTYEERVEYSAAVEDLLKSPDDEKRHYAVILCLGFIVFGDQVNNSKLGLGMSKKVDTKNVLIR